MRKDPSLDCSESAESVYLRVLELRKTYINELRERFPDGAGGIDAAAMRKVNLRHDIWKTWALQAAAREHNIAVGTAKQYMTSYRAARKRRDQAVDNPPPEALQFELFELDVPSTYFVHMRRLRATIHGALYDLKRVRAAIGELRKSDYYPETLAVELERKTLDLALAIKDGTPWGLCPYCKGLDQVMEQCAPCYASGMMSQGQIERVPVRYMSTTVPLVLFQGTDHPVEAFLPKPEEPSE